MCSGHVREETARTLQVAAYHSETDVYQNNSAPGIFIARGAPVAGGGLFASAVRRSLLASVAISVHIL